MANITVLKSGHFRVQIRMKGLKLISRTFQSQAEALHYQHQIESQIRSIRQAELSVDVIALYRSLHPDL